MKPNWRSRTFAALSAGAMFMTGCSVLPNSGNLETEVYETIETNVSATVTPTPMPITESAEALAGIEEAYNYIQTDSIEAALETCDKTVPLCINPDQTLLPFVMSEALGVYNIGRTYRAYKTRAFTDAPTSIDTYEGSKYLLIHKTDGKAEILDAESDRNLKSFVTVTMNSEMWSGATLLNANTVVYTDKKRLNGEDNYGLFAYNIDSQELVELSLGTVNDNQIIANGQGSAVCIYRDSNTFITIYTDAEGSVQVKANGENNLKDSANSDYRIAGDTLIEAGSKAIRGYNINSMKQVFEFEADAPILTDATVQGDKLILTYYCVNEIGEFKDSYVKIIPYTKGDTDNVYAVADSVEIAAEGYQLNRLYSFDNISDEVYVCGGNLIFVINTSEYSVSNILKFDSEIVSLIEVGGTVTSILTDGRSERVHTGLGVVNDFVIRTPNISGVYKVDDDFVITDQSSQMVFYRSEDSLDSVVVTAMDSDAIMPTAMQVASVPDEYSGTAENAFTVGDCLCINLVDGDTVLVNPDDNGEICRFKREHPSSPTAALTYGSYMVLYDSVSGIGYLCCHDVLVGVIDNFISFDPSSSSLYAGADAILNIPIYNWNSLVEYRKRVE